MSGGVENAVSVTFSVDGIDDELLVIRFEGEEAVSRLFSFTLVFGCTSSKLPLEEMVGKAGVLTVEGERGPRYFHGLVNQVQQRESHRKYTVYQAELVPAAFKLQLKRDCRIYQKQGMAAIVGAVLEAGAVKHGFRHKASQEPAVRDYCVQYRESDWSFVSRLLEEEGYYYFFEHHKDKHPLCIGNDYHFHPELPGGGALIFAPPQAMAAGGEHIYTLYVGASVRSGKVTLSDYNFEKPALSLKKDKAAGQEAELELYDYPGGYSLPEKGEALAERQLEEARSHKRFCEGQSNSPRLAAGAVFTLSGHVRGDLNDKKYLLLEVRHRAETSAKDLEAGALDGRCTYENRFLCIPREVPFRPPRLTRKPVVQGVQTAVVVGPKHEEIYVDKHGRVKVQFHWDRLGQGDENSSCWVRVSQLWAGQGFGAMWIPRIGQEVIVDFLEGDPDRPIITGRVYHAINTPPYTLPDEKTKSTIKSKSTIGGQGGNELRFEDKKGAEEIYVHAQKDQNEKVENNLSTSVGANQTLSVGKHRMVTVDGSENVTIKGASASGGVTGGSLTITGDYKVDASKTIEVQAPNHIKLTCGGSSILVEPGTITVTAGGKAVLVLDVNALCKSAAGSQVLLDANATAQSSGGSVMKLDATAGLKASGGGVVKLSATAQIASNAGSSLMLDGDALLCTPGSATVKGTAQATVTAATSTLAGGGGSVQASGPGVTAAGGQVNLSGGMVNIAGGLVKIN